jgi:hypothetical protein
MAANGGAGRDAASRPGSVAADGWAGVKSTYILAEPDFRYLGFE